MTDADEIHIQTRRVRYAECDAMGVLHHARYMHFFEDARIEALRERGCRYRDLEATGVFFVVACLDCRYRRAIRYDDEVTVHTTVTRSTRTRIDHHYEMFVDGKLCAEANTTLACVGTSGQPIVMPDHIWSAHQGARPRRRDRV